MAEPLTPASSNNAIPNRTIISSNVLIIFLVVLALDETEAFIMKLARIYQQNKPAGLLEALDDGSYRFTYDAGLHGEPVSLTMPLSQQVWEFPRFPAPFEGLLPEGVQLDALLRLCKLDRNDFFGQLLAVGHDVVGSLRIEATS
jgi:serine/threonine-protein kinase HipA